MKLGLFIGSDCEVWVNPLPRHSVDLPMISCMSYGLSSRGWFTRMTFPLKILAYHVVHATQDPAKMMDTNGLQT